MKIESALQQELASLAESLGCELVHASFKGKQLQLIIDHPDGVQHEHCANVSRQASHILDASDFGPAGYVLEVSSPGLDRQLFRPKDFQRFVGHRIRIKFRTSEGPNKTVRGELAHFHDGDEPSISVHDLEQVGVEYRIPLSDVHVARLEADL